MALRYFCDECGEEIPSGLNQSYFSDDMPISIPIVEGQGVKFKGLVIHVYLRRLENAPSAKSSAPHLCQSCLAEAIKMAA